jgi:hypothetical protein
MDKRKNAESFLRYVAEWYADFNAHAARRMLSQHYENLAAETVNFMRRQLELHDATDASAKDLLASFIGFVLGWLAMYPMRGPDVEQRAYRDRLKDEAQRVLVALQDEER